MKYGLQIVNSWPLIILQVIFGVGNIVHRLKGNSASNHLALIIGGALLCLLLLNVADICYNLKHFGETGILK